MSPVRVPTAKEYARMPMLERARMLQRLNELRLAWLETEGPDYDPDD